MRYVSAAALFAALALPNVALAGDASMFRENAAHVGVYASQAPSLKAVKWRFHTKARIISSAAVAAGVVYVGSNDGNLYAVSAADGSLIWKFAAKGAVNSSPAVSNGLVFASSLDGNVYAVDAKSGKLRWRFATAGERRFTAPGIHGIMPPTELMPDPYDVFLSSPAVADRTLYIGSGDGNVYAIGASSGRQRWKFQTGNVVHASPAVWNGVVYIGSWDRYFYALDARTGAVRWKFLTGDDRKIFNQVGISSSAAVSNGIVYFGCRDSFLYALDANTGRLLWKHNDRGSWVVGSPAIADGDVLFTTSDEKTFFALDAKSGQSRFSVPYKAFAFSSPAIAGGVAYFGSFDGRLYGVDVRSGRIVARFQSDASKANLAAYETANGELNFEAIYPDSTLDGIIVGLNRIYSLGAFVGSPAITNGVLFVGSADGTLYAIE